METIDYLKILVEDIHSTVVATIGKDGHPVTRCIDMMLYDDDGVYFLTAKGKEFYTQLMEQEYISLSAIKDKRCISLAGETDLVGHTCDSRVQSVSLPCSFYWKPCPPGFAAIRRSDLPGR